MRKRHIGRKLVLAVVSLPLAAACAAAPRAAPDSGTFLVRLGTDTIAVESWTRTADGLEARTAYRTPRTTIRSYRVAMDADGRVTRFAAGRVGEELAERDVVPVGAIPMAGGFYAPFALAVAEARRAGADRTEVQYLMGDRATGVPVRRTAAGVFELTTQFGAPLTVRTDPHGRVVFMEAEGDWTVERIPGLDFEALAREFQARDERGEGLGPLSPRESVQARVGGATVSVEYGSPAARGRTVFGGIVPFGEVWRTGANNATVLTTDRPLEIGGLRVEPGSYSLFTIPDRDGWELIVNRQTDISGLARDADQDVGRVAMRVRPLPEHVNHFTIRIDEAGGAGVLRLQWEHTEAAVDLRAL